MLGRSARADRLVPYKTHGGRKVLTTFVAPQKRGALPVREGASSGWSLRRKTGYDTSTASTAPMELSAVSITGGSAPSTPGWDIQRSASSAAMQPEPAALIAWR